LWTPTDRLTIPEFAPTEALSHSETRSGHFRLTIPEFAPTEATPAASLIFRCDSLLLASDKASRLFK
jgi:hypothetical protein